MEAIRKLVESLVNESGMDLQAASLAIDANQTYLQQFVRYGKPKTLPEKKRLALAKLLKINEARLREVDPDQADNDEVLSIGDFQIPERDVRGGASPSGGQDQSDWQKPASGGSISGHRAVATWSIPVPFARQELGLTPGLADIIPIAGNSMDNGSKDGLSSGDRVILDLTDVDARQGAIFAVWDGTGVIVKQVEIVRGTDPVEIICKSLNKSYDPIRLLLDGNVHIIGRVAAKIARL